MPVGDANWTGLQESVSPWPPSAARLSQELGVRLGPEEVHAHLVLHEIGHTSEAGNVGGISAAINSRTRRRRKELKTCAGRWKNMPTSLLYQSSLSRG